MKSLEYQEPRVQFTEGTGQNLVKPDLRVKENKYFDSFLMRLKNIMIKNNFNYRFLLKET
jgi:hypothetical protein